MTRRKGEEKELLSHSLDKPRCSLCGSQEIMAEIEGKFYCYKCASRILREHVIRQINNWKKLGLVADNY